MSLAPRAVVVHQLAQVAAMVHALHSADLGLLGAAMDDRIAEPARAPLIPGFAEAKRAALDAGALGASISGGGPSIFALCGDNLSALRIAGAMEAFAKAGVQSTRGSRRSTRSVRTSLRGERISADLRRCANVKAIRERDRAHGVHGGGCSSQHRPPQSRSGLRSASLRRGYVRCLCRWSGWPTYW